MVRYCHHRVQKRRAAADSASVTAARRLPSRHSRTADHAGSITSTAFSTSNAAAPLRVYSARIAPPAVAKTTGFDSNLARTSPPPEEGEAAAAMSSGDARPVRPVPSTTRGCDAS